MLSTQQLVTIGSPWSTMAPLRLGNIPSGLGTADLFVVISDNDLPLLRVDLYRDASSESAAFQDVVVWHEHVFVGLGHAVYVVDPKAQRGSSIRLESYFAAFYPGEDYLLVSSADALLRLTADGTVLWKKHGLGLDGVTVKHIENGLVEGDAEWDPPRGWKSFRLRLDSGQLVTD